MVDGHKPGVDYRDEGKHTYLLKTYVFDCS